MDGSRPWWQDAVFYEIYVRSFADSDGDGVGDLAGIRARLPYLRELGVDALWLTPFYPSPGADHGYDVSDYVDVDPQFGTLDDFDALVARRARARAARDRRHRPEPHAPSEHPWFTRRRPLDATSRPAATAAAQQLAVELRRPGVDARRGARRVLPPPLRARAARPRLAQPGGARGLRARSCASGSTAASTASGSTSRTALFKDRDAAGRAGAVPGRRFASDWRTAVDQPEVHDVYRDWRALADEYDGDRVLVGEVVFSDQRARRAVRAPGRAAPGVQLHARLPGVGRRGARRGDRPTLAALARSARRRPGCSRTTT